MKLLRYIRKTLGLKLLNVKVMLFLLLLILLPWDYSQPYLTYIEGWDYPISWCIFPFYLASFGFLTLFYFGIIYINSDVPFMQHINMYQVIRTGRLRWAAGQIGGIFLRSLIITLLMVLFTLLPFLGKIEWSADWGRMVYTLASERKNLSEFASASNNLDFRFYYEILDKFTPVQLMALAVALCTLICTFLGLFMFCISLYGDRMFAMAGALVFVLMLYFCENFPLQKYKRFMAHFVPTYWAEIALMETRTSGYYRMPSLTYMFAFLCIAIAGMSALICLRAKHVEFEWENEDA
ncbi:MAG TPA: hypothetical protein IAB44_15605 [Candidatus Limivivens intestinipullorum]|uniref:Uncharacterized protein n=1 Tax=Candidatus Limivivens intestinipullorum TaxID=2840858 RepID=A0A9D1EWB0_9FIRM|nr:hypothetical protein [Candidatus Limivivens intestinipullorum]